MDTMEQNEEKHAAVVKFVANVFVRDFVSKFSRER